MASSMVIPASKDTLFMRGFSSRLHTDEIKEFFSREAGRNTVEFFKDDGNGQLFIALRFESKDIAKEVLNRFDNVDILGDRVTMSWYKDLRKLRTDNYRRPGGNRHWMPEDQYDYHRDRGMYQRRIYNTRGRWPPQGAPPRPRHYTRSSSRSRSRSFSPSPARSYSRSRSSSGSYESRDKTKKRHSITDSGRRRRPSDKRKIAKTHQSPSLDHDTSASESSAPQGKRGAAKKGDEEGSAGWKRGFAKERNVGEVEEDGADGNADARSDNDFSVEPSSPPSGNKTLRSIRSAVLSVDRTKLHPVSKPAEPEDGAIPDIASPDLLETGKKQEPLAAVTVSAKEAAKTKKAKDDRRIYEEQISDEDESAKERTALAGKKSREDRGNEEILFEKPRGSRLAKSNPVGQVGSTSDLYEPEEFLDMRTSKKRKPTSEDLEYDRASGLDYEEEMEANHNENDSRQRRIDPVSIQDLRQPRGPYDGATPALAKRRPVCNESINSANRGALGLSQEKMSLIRDKKEEIEKAYRQDCETFVTVTKLLIRKDPDLEERVQSSLRENLKEIGQRCIQELQDFVDRLKTEDDP